MGWKETEQKVLAGLSDIARVWVTDNVNLEPDNDLTMMTRSALIAMFPEKKKPKDPSLPVVKKLADVKCMRTLIWQEWLRIRNHEHDALKGNLRSFWYRILEPFYMDKDLLESDAMIPVSVLLEACAQVDEERGERLRERMYGRSPSHIRKKLDALAPGLVSRIWRNARETYLQNCISICFDAFVKNAVFRFQDEFQFQDPRKNFRIMGKKRARVVFYTEKEGLWWLCEYAAEKHGITAIASNGEPGLLALEYFYDDLRSKKVGSLIIGAITDYDPWGAQIADNFIEKMRYDIFYTKDKVNGQPLNATQTDIARLFTPEELERGKRDLTKYSQYKQEQVQKWFNDTGGIGGGLYGIHVDLARQDALKKEVDRWVKSVKDI